MEITRRWKGPASWIMYTDLIWDGRASQCRFLGEAPYIHTYIPTYLHTYVHTYIHT